MNGLEISCAFHFHWLGEKTASRTTTMNPIYIVEIASSEASIIKLAKFGVEKSQKSSWEIGRRNDDGFIDLLQRVKIPIKKDEQLSTIEEKVIPDVDRLSDYSERLYELVYDAILLGGVCKDDDSCLVLCHR